MAIRAATLVCPRCNSQSLDIQVKAWALVKIPDPDNDSIDAGTIDIELNGEIDYDLDSMMVCTACYYSASAREFIVGLSENGCLGVNKGVQIDAQGRAIQVSAG